LTYIATRPQLKILLSKRFETYGSNPPRRHRVAAGFCGENGCSWNTVPVWREAVGVSVKKRRIPKEARLCLLWASLGGEPKVLAGVGCKPAVLASLGGEPKVLAGLGCKPAVLASLGGEPKVLAGLGCKP